MALVKFGGGVIQMSGSIAGNTFARNSYGNYVRARTTPVNPQTANQTAVRSAIAFLADAWSQLLSAAQRAAWDDYAAAVAMSNRLGESVFLSGYNHYLRSNSVRKRSAIGLRNPGPTILELPAQDPTMTITGSAAAGLINISFDDSMAWANEDSGAMMVFQGKPVNAQRNFFDGPWRIIGTIQGDSASPAVTPTALAVDFAIAENQRQYVYARISRADGRLSEPFRANVLVSS